MTAFSGTRTLRNTTISSRKLSSRTTPISSGMRPPRNSEKSVDAAVRPPTLASTPVCGITSSRSVFTRVVVASSCGALSG